MQKRDWSIIGVIAVLVVLGLLLPMLALPNAAAVDDVAVDDVAVDDVAVDDVAVDTVADADPQTSLDTEDRSSGGVDSPESESAGSSAVAEADSAAPGNLDSVDFEPYLDENERFELRYPAAWLVVDNEETSPGNVNFIDVTSGSPEAWAYVNVAYAPISDLAVFVAQMQRGFSQQAGVENFRVREEQSAIVNGLPAVEQIMRFELRGIVVAQRTYYVQSGSNAFVLSLIVPDAAFDVYEATFDEIVSSFVPREATNS